MSYEMSSIESLSACDLIKMRSAQKCAISARDKRGPIEQINVDDL